MQKNIKQEMANDIVVGLTALTKKRQTHGSIGGRGFVHTFKADTFSSKWICFAKHVIGACIKDVNPVGGMVFEMD